MRTRFTLAALLVTLGACNATEPMNPIDGPYRIFTINESALPYTLPAPSCCRYENGSLVFAGGKYDMWLSGHNVNNGLAFTAREWGHFTQTSTTVTFARDSFQLQPLLLDVATLSNGDLHVNSGGNGPGSADQFRLVWVRNLLD